MPSNAVGRLPTVLLVASLVAGCQATEPAVPASPAPSTGQGAAIGLVMPSAVARPAAETRDGSLDSAVIASAKGDAAWIAAADRQFGLRIYALDGDEVSAFGVGRLNGVDAIAVADDRYVLAASNASANALSLFTASIDDGVLTVGTLNPIALTMTAPDGLCMERVDDRLGVYVADRTGQLEEWHIDAYGSGVLSRTMSFAGQARACVVDRSRRTLYVADDAAGIWSLDLASGELKLVDGRAEQKLLPGASGLGIHASPDGDYLVASGIAGRGVGVYALPAGEAEAAFRVNPNAELGIDGMPVVSGVTAFGEPLPAYPAGIVIVHDGSGNERSFKLVDWRAVRTLIGSR